MLSAWVLLSAPYRLCWVTNSKTSTTSAVFTVPSVSRLLPDMQMGFTTDFKTCLDMTLVWMLTAELDKAS